MKKTLFKMIPAALLLVVLIGVFLPTTASAKKASSEEIRNEITNLEKEQAELEKELKKLEEQLGGNREELKEIVARKDVIDQSLNVIRTQVININEQIAAHSLLIADKQEELDKAQQELEYLRKKYKERIRAMEEGGTVSYWTVLFEANSFSDLLDRINMVREIAEADAGRIKVLDEAAKEVEAAKLALDEERIVLDRTRAELETKKLQLAQNQEESNILLLDLLKKGQEYLDLIEQSEDAIEEMIEKRDEMQVELSAAEKREYEEWLRQQQAQYNTTRPTYESSGVVWALPCDYTRLSSPFGKRVHPVTGEVGKMHNGVDLAAPGGTPIYATRAGVVTFAGFDSSGGGNSVYIDHQDGYKSYYMHMNNDSIGVVKYGQWVNIGELIGYVGTTGSSTGNHLHFGIKKKINGTLTWVNPSEYLDLPVYYKKQ